MNIASEPLAVQALGTSPKEKLFQHFFPLIEGTKQPAVKGWRLLPVGAYKAENCYGIALQRDELILDVDPRNYPEGRDVLAELRAEFKVIPTRVVRTPSGGMHIYLHNPTLKRIRKTQSRYPGIDFLSEGSFAAGPGSYQKNEVGQLKGEYKLISEGPILEAPWELVRSLEEPADGNMSGDGKYSLAKLEDFRTFCQSAEPAIEGKQGDTTTYRVACKGRDFGLPKKATFEVMLDCFNPRCIPTWSEDKLRDKVEHAYTYAKSKVGCLNAAEDFEAFAPTDRAENSQALLNSRAYPRTDIGNAQRLADRFGKVLKWFKNEKNFLVWEAKRWKRDTLERPLTFCKIIADDLWQEGLKAGSDESRKFAAQSASRAKLEAMLATSKDLIALDVASLDEDPLLFNCSNGTLDLRAGELKPHDPADYITKLSPVAFIPGAEAPTFEKFLQEIFDGNAGLIEFVQCALGSCLTGQVRDQVLYVAHGGGSNGKSTLMNAVRKVMGDYGIETEAALLTAKPTNGPSEGLYNLRGTRFATTTETDDGAELNEAQVKKITGGDPLRARPLHGHLAEFMPTHKVWLVTNHRPTIKGQDHAIWRRIKLIPFVVQISEDRKDVHLPEKLDAESEGILVWLVRGAEKWLKNGLPKCRAVEVATADYRATEDALEEFLSESCCRGEGYKVGAAELKHEYHMWCKKGATQPLTKNAFPEQMRAKGFEQKQSNGKFYWQGVCLKSSLDDAFSEFI